MDDPRIHQAQTLHWQIETLRGLGAHSATLRPRHREIARIYEERAREILASTDGLGWTDLFAAVTHWAEAGEAERAQSLLHLGDRLTTAPGEANAAIRSHLDELRSWLREHRVIPSLAAYARALPPTPKAAL